VDRFDHHCPCKKKQHTLDIIYLSVIMKPFRFNHDVSLFYKSGVGNCIGRRNYVTFIKFLTCVVLLDVALTVSTVIRGREGGRCSFSVCLGGLSFFHSLLS
jgi:hypothetical protein